MKTTNKNTLTVLLVAFVLTAVTGCDYVRKGIEKIEGEMKAVTDDEPEHSDSVTITAYSNEVKVGSNPDFLADVEATNKDGKIDVSVDTSEVDLSQDGDYPVTYSATGTDGVTTTKTVRLKVTDPRKRVIYLTFDDGPSANTGRILQILKENDVNATFFVTAQNPGCFHYITEAYDFGNAIAAHTYSHNFGIYRSFDAYFADLDKIQEVIKKHTGKTTNIIRFPGGSSNKMFHRFNSDPNFMYKLSKEVLNRGYQYVDWNADSRDASCNFPTARFVANSACHTYANELCLLMHDTQAKNGTVAALPEIIKFFKDQGYEFRTITSTGYVCHHTLREVKPVEPAKTVDPTKSTESTKPVVPTKAPVKTTADSTVKTSTKPVTKPASQPAIKPETKSDTKTETKPVTEPDLKPVPEHHRKDSL